MSSTSDDRHRTSSDNAEDFIWDESEAIATAWSSARESRPRRRMFGSKAGFGGRAFSFKKKPIREAQAEESSDFLLESAQDLPDFSRLGREQSLTSDESSESFARSSEASSGHPVVEPHFRSTSSALPPVPKPIRMCRSFSLQLGSTPADKLFRERSSTSSSTEDLLFSPWGGENADPNQHEKLLEPAKEGEQRERKKIRARRNSIQGHIASLSDMQSSSSFSALAADKDAWSKSSPGKLDFGDFDAVLSPARSVASSRKRGVCGSPISDLDDWSTSGGLSGSLHSSSSLSRRGRSRSRIFSPDPKASLPLAPSLTLDRNESDRRAMDVDSDADSESNGANSSPDTSFQSTGGNDTYPTMQSTAPTTEENAKEDDDVFATMSSYKDLKFLIKALRKETSGKGAVASFGMSNSCTVAPPIAWSSKRRSAFFQWAKECLGFVVRTMGGSINFLQISKTKGAEVKAKLEAALIAYKQKGVEKKAEPSRPPIEDSFALMDTSDRSRKPPGTELRTQTQTTPFLVQAMSDAFTDQSAADLAAELESLTVKDTAIVRTVTIDPAVSSTTGASRPSFDQQVGSQDLMMQLQGYSPCNESVKPPKLSLASVCSASTLNRNSRGGSLPYAGNLVPIQSLDFVETPLMKQDEGWGSRPIQGKDWGATCRCEESILEVLFSRLEESCQVAGIRDSFSPTNNKSLPLMPFGQELGDLELNGPTSARRSNGIETCASEPAPDVQMSTHDEDDDKRQLRRRKVSFAKHKRMSLWASATDGPLLPSKKPLFRAMQSLGRVSEIRPSLSPLEEFPSRDSADLTAIEDEPSKPSIDEGVLPSILSFLDEGELLTKASLVSAAWADAATTALAEMMVASVGYSECTDDDEDDVEEVSGTAASLPQSMQRDWVYLNTRFPWGCFLSEGAFKKVYKVYNTAVGAEEALSVMDVDAIVDKKTIAAELLVSALLSSLTRRGICPNFILTRGVFTCPYEPSTRLWGCAENKRPKGSAYVEGKSRRLPREPTTAHPGRYQYIRMELCNEGDAEEWLKRQPYEAVDPTAARSILFQLAFALHAAADRFSVKHYDIKLLNVFIQDIKDRVKSGGVVLRYGLGSHVFALQMPPELAVIAKVADYGTANVKPDSNGQPVTIAQFTTLENTPPDFMILGDDATQGHAHDCFGLGLCMLHLFTGHAPYEEIMEEVTCPLGLKKKLRKIWENESVANYDVIRSVILSDVYKDEAGHIIEGEPDDTLYDTLYRHLVLFGIPEKFQEKKRQKVWKAISESLEGATSSKSRGGRPVRKKQGSDVTQYNRDCKKYSLRTGNNKYIARARDGLERMDGGMELLFDLCAFDPSKRASAMDVLNSAFMEDLREEQGNVNYGEDITVFSYTAFSTS